MIIKLIEGEFSDTDAVEIISQMINVKVKYHESKITSNSNEEDIKAREVKIKNLQSELSALRRSIKSIGTRVKIQSIIKVE